MNISRLFSRRPQSGSAQIPPAPDSSGWEDLTVAPAKVLAKIEPGMSIFLGTGVSEPRTLVKHLMSSQESNLQDLELIQLISLGDAVSVQGLSAHRYRLKTFFAGWVASEAIAAGRVDLIPSRFSRIPALIKGGQLPINAAFVQITPPNEAGYCSLGVTVDVARQAMEQAQLVVGEINPQIPFTFGDTFVPLSDFDFVVKCDQEPLLFPRWPVEEVHDQVAANLASVIQDGSCLAFSIGPLYEALARHLARKRNLGIHSPHFTDALMDLVKSGAVSNRYKQTYKGKSLTSYALGSGELMAWLDRNPMVEFQGLEVTFDPLHIGRNPNFVALLPARKVDLSGRIALPAGKGNVVAGPGEALDYLIGAQISPGGQTIFALPSRNREGSANILLSVENLPNQISIRESVDLVITEYGIASLQGRTVRERAQALIDIAHPQDRAALVEQAKAKRILYEDQIFLPESAQLYPDDITHTHTFGDGLEVRFRAIKPSDEEEMRRLFYRFSDEAIYYRYFSPIRAMPHAKMQEYVNIDYQRVMSLVGLTGEAAGRHIIAEGRYVLSRYEPFADVAFVVDEDFQGRGIATYLVKLLKEVARKQGIKGFTADVLASNRAMMKVFEKSNLKVHARLEEGEYRLTIPLEDLPV